MVSFIEGATISDYSNMLLVVIASITAIIAYRQYRISRYENKLALAKSLYKDYLTLAFENPEFATASYPKDQPKYNSIKTDVLRHDKYDWYVSHLLMAAEEILDLTGNDEEWQDTVHDQLKYHALYLDTVHFQEKHTTKAVLKLKEKAILSYKSEH